MKQRYLKHGMLAILIEMMFLPSMLKALPSSMDAKGYKKRVKKEYKAMLERTPGLGGNSMEPTLYVAAFIFSLYKADEKNITPEVVDKMVDEVFASKMMAKQVMKCTLFTDKVQDRKVKASRASQSSTYELDWKFDYVKGKDEFHNTYTECGICKLARRENCFPFVKCLCNMDERNYWNEGGVLHRTMTLAEGSPCCDFHVTKREDL